MAREVRACGIEGTVPHSTKMKLEHRIYHFVLRIRELCHPPCQACVDQNEKGQHETKVPDLGNAEDGEEDGGSEASELSGEARHSGPQPERANPQGEDSKQEPPVNEAGEKSDATRSKGDATGKEISADEDKGGSSQKRAEESILMDPSRSSPDAKLDATRAEPERLKPDRAAVKQKEAKLKSDSDTPVGAEDTSPHVIPESSSKGEDESPKAVDQRAEEVQGKPRSEKVPCLTFARAQACAHRCHMHFLPLAELPRLGRNEFFVRRGRHFSSPRGGGNL